MVKLLVKFCADDASAGKLTCIGSSTQPLNGAHHALFHSVSKLDIADSLPLDKG
jgi:hypothetical protein